MEQTITQSALFEEANSKEDIYANDNTIGASQH